MLTNLAFSLFFLLVNEYLIEPPSRTLEDYLRMLGVCCTDIRGRNREQPLSRVLFSPPSATGCRLSYLHPYG